MPPHTRIFLVFTLLLLYVCFYSVLITITLPMVVIGAFQIGLNDLSQIVLEAVLGPWVAGRLRRHDDLILEGVIAERRRLGEERPMPGEYVPEEGIGAPQPQQGAGRTYRILFMETQMGMPNRIARYRGWLHQMEQAADWVAEDAQADDDAHLHFFLDWLAEFVQVDEYDLEDDDAHLHFFLDWLAEFVQVDEDGLEDDDAHLHFFLDWLAEFVQVDEDDLEDDDAHLHLFIDWVAEDDPADDDAHLDFFIDWVAEDDLADDDAHLDFFHRVVAIAQTEKDVHTTPSEEEVGFIAGPLLDFIQMGLHWIWYRFDRENHT